VWALLKNVMDSCLHCGRAVPSPVRLTNLTHKPKEETYYACPFCFSRLETEEVPDHLECVHGHSGLNASSAVNVLHSRSEKNATKFAETSSTNCAHGYGYLNNRPKDASIPDECLTCARILQCMTKSL
jgi:DNA-directed RNA polymerase subunit RPC12/RpoP